MLNSNAKDQSPKTLGAILLAAGRSERMGAFKPLLPFGKKTVIEACINYLQESEIEPIVVVLGHRPDEIRKQLKTLSLSFAVNPDPRSEMSDSIACGVAELPETTPATLIALVDHPAIPVSVVTALRMEWEKGARLVVPTWEKRGGHPVLVDLSLRRELLTLDPARGLKGLFDRHHAEVRHIPVESPYIARDMDTWDDYRALYEDVFGAEPPQSGP